MYDDVHISIGHWLDIVHLPEQWVTDIGDQYCCVGYLRSLPGNRVVMTGSVGACVGAGVPLGLGVELGIAVSNQMQHSE